MRRRSYEIPSSHCKGVRALLPTDLHRGRIDCSGARATLGPPPVPVYTKEVSVQIGMLLGLTWEVARSYMHHAMFHLFTKVECSGPQVSNSYLFMRVEWAAIQGFRFVSKQL